MGEHWIATLMVCGFGWAFSFGWEAATGRRDWVAGLCDAMYINSTAILVGVLWSIPR
jgi:hypothetical protein